MTNIAFFTTPIMKSIINILVIVFSLFVWSGCTPRNFDSDIQEAEAKMGMGDPEGALEIYRRVVDRYPADPRRAAVWLIIGDIYDNTMNSDELASEAYGRVISEYPFSFVSITARERRAAIMQKTGQTEAVIEDYAALVKYFPEHADRFRFRILLAGAYLAQKNFSQARIELKPLFYEKELPPEVREQILFAAGESYFLENRLREAIPFYQAMLKEFPNSKLASEAELHLATCVEEQGFLGTAKEMTQDAGRDYPNKEVIETRLKSLEKRGKKAGAVSSGKKNDIKVKKRGKKKR